MSGDDREPTRRYPAKRAAVALVMLGALGILATCSFDKADRWAASEAAGSSHPPATCQPGQLLCQQGALKRCDSHEGAPAVWSVVDDCQANGLVCAPSLLRCTRCIPDKRSCSEQQVMVCKHDGTGQQPADTCNTSQGSACRGGACVDLCLEAKSVKSNVGCEYWAVDLDNADISDTKNAAAQQFAVVVSNPQRDVQADVVIAKDDGTVGSKSQPVTVAEGTVPPNSLRVFKLDAREVDGSPPGTFDQGPGTAISRTAYRIRSTVPVVAFQFNPLDNVNVFSNDASLLKPVEAAPTPNGSMDEAYVVVGWPQTIAHTDDPNTNFNPNDPIDLRAFLTIVATTPDTHVQVRSSTKVVAGEGLPAMSPGDTAHVTLQPFEVFNLETGGFNADFTGSIVSADQPVLVFSGGEASDAPYFSKLSERSCCADHLEEQLDPIRTAGKRFFAAHAPNRTIALRAAGAHNLGEVAEPEYFRVVAVNEGITTVTTTMDGPDKQIVLKKKGAHHDFVSKHPFYIDADKPVLLASVQASQEAAGIPRGFPGGDPSMIVIPPVEQYRTNYTFLTPDKYAFDFITVVANASANVLLDGVPVQSRGCKAEPADGLDNATRGGPPTTLCYTCQLSFPVVQPKSDSTADIRDGIQDDGVHHVDADLPVMVLVYGFDRYVSYGYAAGTQLASINIR